uniref:Uncharacterized protein n=1 Tax=Suricata suricatta TaxID=37032 RepID=A0A673UV51_SURSU
MLPLSALATEPSHVCPTWDSSYTRNPGLTRTFPELPCSLGFFSPTFRPSSSRKFVHCSDLLKLKIFHQITQKNPGSRNT